jgi:hypothetical protein
MNVLTCGNRGRIGALSLTLALAGIGGCGSAEPEAVEQVVSALGSTKPQQTINNWTQLTQMVSDGNYLLTTNLNAAGQTWTVKDFTGTFDGGGKIISNLTVNVGSGGYTGFFGTITNAIVRNVRFTTMTVNGQSCLGGVAGYAQDSLIELVGVEGNINGSNAIATGGLLGEMSGGKIVRSYARGSVNSSIFFAGGLVGTISPTAGWGAGEIYQSYAWTTVAPDTSVVNRPIYAGGIAGLVNGSTIQEVYAVGNVTGRGYAGGLVGAIGCWDPYFYVLNHGIYRGDVVDKNLSSSGGWSGTFGPYDNTCAGRFDQLIWDRSMDGSSNVGVRGDAQKSATETELMTPTTVTGGVYFFQDNFLPSDIWSPGSSSQHHALRDMPGGLTIQPRCVVNGVPTAC